MPNTRQAVSLGDALFSKTQQKLLRLLHGKPDQTFFTNEIVRWAEMGKGSIARELERMHEAIGALENAAPDIQGPED